MKIAVKQLQKILQKSYDDAIIAVFDLLKKMNFSNLHVCQIRKKITCVMLIESLALKTGAELTLSKDLGSLLFQEQTIERYPQKLRVGESQFGLEEAKVMDTLKAGLDSVNGDEHSSVILKEIARKVNINLGGDKRMEKRLHWHLFDDPIPTDARIVVKLVESRKLKKSKVFEKSIQGFECVITEGRYFPHHHDLADVEEAMKDSANRPVFISKEEDSDRTVISLDFKTFAALLEEAGYKLEEIEVAELETTEEV